MYDKILVTLDTTPTDRTIIEHVKALAKFMHSRVVLQKVKAEFEAAGIPAEAELAFGEPGAQVVKWVETKSCDLVAMSTHGHRFVGDLFLGSTSRRVRHSVSVPVLLLRAK
jgi:nucleotide-binding universal stress UspA family protein